MWAIVGWIVWGLCAALTGTYAVTWYEFARARRDSALALGVQAGLWLSLVVAFVVEPWSKLHLLWCFPLAYFAGLFIASVTVGLRMYAAVILLERRLQAKRMQQEMRTDREWSAIEQQACRVIDFTPFASVENGEVVAPNISDPYALVTLECTGMPTPVKGFITHKVDFAHLWAAFEERGLSDDEEVIVFWTAKDYKYGFLRFLSRVLPKMWVTVRRKGSSEILQKLCDPTRPSEPGFDWMAAMRAIEPIVEWKPEVMR